jgi:hypothetical protein
LTAAGRFVRWTAFGYSVIAFLGIWVPPLRDLPPGPSLVRDMPAASSVSLSALAFGALLAGEVSQPLGSNLFWRRVSVTVSLGVAAFGALIIYVFFANQTAIWGDSLESPAFSVGVVLVVLGLAVPLSVSRIEGRVIAGQVGALLVFSLAAVIYLGYAYGDPSVGRLFLTPEISFQSSLVSVLAAVGILLIRPASGLLSTASSPGSGGRLLRWFGPVVLFMPAILLLIIEIVPLTDRIDVLAFVSVGLGLFLLVLLSFFVRALDATAIEAATLAAQAERARTGLEQEAPVVSGMASLFHIVDVSDIDGWEVATRFRPGRGTVAGDSSAVFALPDGALGAVMVDLTGHGADPAIWAIRVRDLLLQSLIVGKTPTEAMGLVEWSVPDDVLASAIVLRLDPTTGRVKLCSAGHPPAIVIGEQEASLKSPTGPLLYLRHSMLYEEHEFVLAAGHSIIAFSDGVADVQMTRDGLTEPESLAELLASEAGPASRTADLVLAFADPDRGDDQTVVVIRRNP